MSGTLNPGPVAFDYVAWTTRYPEFSTVSQDLATLYFSEACLYLDNTVSSIVQDGSPGGQRAMLLNMLTAHIAALNSGVNGQSASQLVGRISDATEGSVSVRSEYTAPGTAAWYAQTKYCASFWAATAYLRTMQYRVPYTPFNVG